MLLPILAFALSAVQPIVVKAPPPSLFDSPRVSDADLADMRGGFNLPDGLNVAIGIDVETRIDGVLALHTVYNSDGPDAGIHAYAGDSGPASSGGTVVPGAAPGASVSVSRSSSGTTVISTPSAGPTNVTMVSTAAPAASSTAGALPLTANGAAVQTASGSYTLTTNDRGNIVTFNGPSIEVQHLIGQATGVVIANTANDRTIDTTSTVNIDMSNVPVAAINSAFIAARAAFDSARAQ
jgi:hypothetical protein